MALRNPACIAIHRTPDQNGDQSAESGTKIWILYEHYYSIFPSKSPATATKKEFAEHLRDETMIGERKERMKHNFLMAQT